MHQKLNIKLIHLNSNQKKARNEFSQNYVDSDYTKMIFKTNVFLKMENKEIENVLHTKIV